MVDASSGLGETVVSGLVTPDHYVLTPSGEVAACTPGRCEVVIRSTADGDVTNETGVPVERLPGAALCELARLGTEVAAHFGRPQDIEWAYTGGKVSLVQARPMTALPPPPLKRLNPIQRKLGSILLEYVPVRPYPIDMSTWLPYGPAGLMGKATGHFGVHGVFDRFLEEQDGVVYRLLPPTPHPTPRVLTAPFRFAAKARRYDPARWLDDPRMLAFLDTNRELTALDLDALPSPELARVPRRALDAVQPVAELGIDYLPGTGRALLRLLLVAKPPTPAPPATRRSTGCSRTPSCAAEEAAVAAPG